VAVFAALPDTSAPGSEGGESPAAMGSSARWALMDLWRRPDEVAARHPRRLQRIAMAGTAPRGPFITLGYGVDAR
jgi:hypothetical protein